MTRYGLLAALLGVLGLSGALVVTMKANAALRVENEALSARLITCDARLANITEDKESDHAVDAIPDDGLRIVPDHWLRE